jgi:crotonobetainyl-CoA:carnitine CoA-transferase CaiB-like acyl-CoA transferase
MRPLDGISVLDFTTLLPGPFATLILAEAGARVTKIERPGAGDDVKLMEGARGRTWYALLNRGKSVLPLDLKAPADRERLRPLLETADVLVEQFRPGVMDRLGLGWDSLSALNPRLVYCSISGYGQTGPRKDVAGHDLNYLAASGLLGLLDPPAPPPALIADVGGGTYPAVINILLALQLRERTGQGSRIDVAMTDNVFPFLWWALSDAAGLGKWPVPGREVFTGGSPRYQCYRTRDGRYLAAAPLEDRFWREFCAVLDLPLDADKGTVAAVIARRSAAEWQEAFAGRDACVALVASLEEALADPQFRARGLFAWKERVEGRSLPALAVPVDRRFRADPAVE